MKADVKSRLDKAVKDGDLTQAQADDLLAHLDDALSHIGDARPRFFRHRHRGGAPDMRPGGFAPGGPGAPELAAPDGVVS